MKKDKLSGEVQLLIDAGEAYHKSIIGRTHIDGRPFYEWLPACRNLLSLIGKFAGPFSDPFRDNSGCDVGRTQKMIGALRALKGALDRGLLISIEELIFADVAMDLIDQAEELRDKGYLLAAGVLCRAVFEEHLKKLCDSNSCLPVGRPTIETLKVALQGKQVLTKLDAKTVDLIGGMGNHCAHNASPPFGRPEIDKLIENVQDFIRQHPFN
jgi:hypothetical protein